MNVEQPPPTLSNFLFFFLAGYFECVLSHNRSPLFAADYHDLHKWSVENTSAFWKAVWEYTDILHSVEFTEVVEDKSMDQIPKWFKGARLNYAENTLRWNDDHVALV
jgi:acetoacetyl-CoA synthetase